MGLLKKIRRKGDADDQPMEIGEDEAVSVLEPASATGNNVEPEHERDKELALLDQYLSSRKDEEEEEQAAAPQAPEKTPPAAASPADDADDLMDIFKSEQEDDTDMSAVTKDLEEIDASALLAQAREVAARLRRSSGAKEER